MADASSIATVVLAVIVAFQFHDLRKKDRKIEELGKAIQDEATRQATYNRRARDLSADDSGMRDLTRRPDDPGTD